MSGKTIEDLRAELEAKRAANLAKEAARNDEAGQLTRAIEIEDKRAEAYAQGLSEEQLLEATFPGVGRVLVRTPQDLHYRSWSKKSGAIKGDLTTDPAVHDELIAHCMLAPDYKTFAALARERCPRAPTQLVGAIMQRMEGKVEAEGK